MNFDVDQQASKFRRLPHCAGFGKQHDGDAGYDLYASFDADLEMFVHQGRISSVPTGIQVACQPTEYFHVCPRSGMGSRGIQVLAGVVDSSYRGEVVVFLTNITSVPYKIRRGDRIAQLLHVRLSSLPLREVNELDVTDRGAQGFGSTGK